MPDLAVAQPASYPVQNPHQRAASPSHEIHAHQPGGEHDHASGQCNICLDDMYNVSPDDPALNANERYGVTRDGKHVRLECGHTYHKRCAVGEGDEKGFLHHNTSCPTCRHEVKPQVLNSINRQLNLNLRPISAVERMNETLREDLENGHQDVNSAENQGLWEAELHQRASHPDELQRHNAHHNDNFDLFTLLHGFRPLYPVRRRYQHINIFEQLLTEIVNTAINESNDRVTQEAQLQPAEQPARRARRGRRHRQRQRRARRLSKARQSARVQEPAVRVEPFRPPALFNHSFGLLGALNLEQPLAASSFTSPFGFGCSFHQPAGLWFGDDMIINRPHRIFLI